jgi:predicted RNA-binding protein associated with RNAse of E/G family
MWKPGETIVWRGIYRKRVWHAQTVIVVKDTAEEIVVALLPGTECMVPEGYSDGKQSSTRRWAFKEKQWELERLRWHTNRLLFLLAPEKYYSTILFWDDQSDKFLFYYLNFQLPFQRSQMGIDTLDLELDLIIHPDFSYEWKDMDDYEKGIETEIILPEWMRGIETAKREILDRLEERQYPYDGSWLDWKPEPAWAPPGLPKGWDQVER